MTHASARSSSAAAEVTHAIAAAHRHEWAAVMAATARVTRDLDLAEDCVQDAYAQALVHWPQSGIPSRPGAWLTTVATRRALELQRRASTLTRKLPLLVTDVDSTRATIDTETDDTTFPDDRLRLIFICCHPALSSEAQLALTLRLVCGLTTAEVARAFLVKEATMQARITRAKQKIAEARIPYRLPSAAERLQRVGVVLDAIHLLSSSGYTATAGDDLLRGDLAERALDLAQMMHTLLPNDGEVLGLLALLHLTEARRPARVSDSGQLIVMEEQDRALWDQQRIASGLQLVRAAIARPPVRRYALMAAIAAVHAEAPTWEDTDWPQLVGLYDLLLQRWPNPVVALNRAAALSFVAGPAAALAILDDLAADPQLATYPYLAATRADLYRRLNRPAAAIAAYQEALRLTRNTAEADYLAQRIASLRADADTITGSA